MNNIKINNSFLLKVGLLLLGFIYIYTPPFKLFPFTPSYLIIGLSILYVFAYERTNFIKFISNKNIFLLTLILIFIICYSFFWDLSTTYPKSVTFTNSMTIKNSLILLQSFFVPFFFVHILRNRFNYNIYDLLHYFVVIATIQSFFVILMLLIPSFREYSFLHLMSFSEDSKELHPLLWRIRSFGFSSQYLFAYPVFQGIAIMFSTILSITRSTKYILTIPLILVSIIFNARIGFIPIIVFALLLTLGATFLLKTKVLSRLIKLISLAGIVLFTVALLSKKYELVETFSKTLQWIASDFESGESQTASVLVTNHLFLPDSTLSIIFGEGRYLFMNPSETVSSDMGYVNYMFFGGFVYIFIMILFLCLISLLSFCYTKDFNIRVLIVSLLITVLLVNIKGLAFQGSSFFNVFLLFNFYIIIDKFYQKKEVTAHHY